MIRTIAVAAIAVGVAVGNPALAASCKDAAGKVIKCPTKPLAQKTCTVKGKLAPCAKAKSQVTDVTNRASYKW